MLKFDINALCMIEDLKGRSFLSLLNDTAEMEKFATTRLLFWAGLLHANERLSLADAGKKMTELIASGKSLLDIAQMVNDAILASELIELPQEGAENPPATA